MANEPEPECTPVKPVMKKLMYKSPLSGIRSTPYKPPVDKSGFKPLGVSSPKLEDGSGDRFALAGEGPSPLLSLKTQHVRPPSLDSDTKPYPLGGDGSAVLASLRGRGGHWMGPQGSNMSPENRRGGRRHGFNSSPASEGDPQWYGQSPIQNSGGYRGGNNRGNNDSFGRNSFRQNNFGNNSFGSNPNSPRGQFNSPDRSRYNSPRNNSKRGKRGGSRSKRPSVDISMYYSHWMTRDPWSDLMRDKMNDSSFQSKTLNQTLNQGSMSLMNLTSDGEMDEGINSNSQDNDTPVGDDSS